MPWHLNRNERIVCTGPCSLYREPGFVPCPVDHDAQPFNDVDTEDGTPFYRCMTCDWVRPDPFGENKTETAGMIVCPECENGERNDTFNGPCDFCSSKNRTASWHPVPEHLQALAKKSFYSGKTWWCCPPCFCEKTTRLEAEKAEADQKAAEADRWRWYRHVHREAGLPTGTCDRCREIDFLVILGDGPGEEYICVRCAPRFDTQIHPEETSSMPAAGWYPDPEEPDEFLRWWSGTEWSGMPTLPEHVLVQ